MALPARNRETLQFACEGKIVVTIDMREPCLLLYPLPDWEVVQGKLEGLSNINPQARMLQRLLIGHATDLELDANGRVLIPALLREYAKLEKKVVLVGQGNKIELWAEQEWRERMEGWLNSESPSALDTGELFDGLSL
jgi:MraZ protein